MSVDVVGLRALAEKALAGLNSAREGYGAASAFLPQLEAIVREIVPALDEIATLRAEVADRDARIGAALAMADEFEYVSDVDLRLALSGPAVPVPQDNPEAWVTAPDGEEFRRGACQGHDCCTAKLHEHGCFADYDGSKCDHPEAHQSTGEQAEYLCYICGGRPQEQGGVCSDECETSVNTESTVPSPDVRPKNGEKP